MSKIMPLEELSSIKGATSSEVITELFGKVKNSVEKIDETIKNEISDRIIDLEFMREDIVIKAKEDEISIILQNFPLQKEGYLVVPRVIEE